MDRSQGGTRFSWPGLYRDMNEYCRACEDGNRDTCPEHHFTLYLPHAEEPFKRVAVDIMGPLQRTKHGHKYICTRYPEAVPLMPAP
jgi:hypothetical protein